MSWSTLFFLAKCILRVALSADNSKNSFLTLRFSCMPASPSAWRTRFTRGNEMSSTWNRAAGSASNCATMTEVLCWSDFRRGTPSTATSANRSRSWRRVSPVERPGAAPLGQRPAAATVVHQTKRRGRGGRNNTACEGLNASKKRFRNHCFVLSFIASWEHVLGNSEALNCNLKPNWKRNLRGCSLSTADDLKMKRVFF